MMRPALLRTIALGLAGAVGIAGLTGLGVWQLQRRVWKIALIEQVSQRIHAPPAAAPGPGDWSRLSAQRDAYRRVFVSGRYLPQSDTLVDASTDLGVGYWVLSPLRRNDGEIVLINRGFVPKDPNVVADPPPPSGVVTVTGLLRLSEPGGRWLRPNQPRSGRWFSRDVAAISRAKGLAAPAPYFIDEEAPGGKTEASWPRPGLTVVTFSNNHLIYALTWFALAGLLAYGLGLAAWTHRSAILSGD